MPTAPQSISVQGVSYRYPAGDHDELSDVNLTLPPGHVVAVVGPNGSGKSTLAKMRGGLIPPTTGRIRWDDVDTSECHRAAVRQLVAPKFQDFTRYEHSAAEAIGFGDLSRMTDRDALTETAVAAGADVFVRPLPWGYDTLLSTAFAGGTDLSCGRWQRMAIARSFFRNAPLALIDEPAAALDPRAEQDLFERLDELGRNRMVLFISHRFATVHRADHIIVLINRLIVEQGKHAELMSLGGVYAELYTSQADDFA